MGRLTENMQVNMINLLVKLLKENMFVSVEDAYHALNTFYPRNTTMFSVDKVKYTLNVLNTYINKDWNAFAYMGAQNNYSSIVGAIVKHNLLPIPDSCRQEIEINRREYLAGNREEYYAAKRTKKPEGIQMQGASDHQLSIEEIPHPSENVPDGGGQTVDIQATIQAAIHAEAESIYQQFKKDCIDPLIQNIIGQLECLKAMRSEMNANHDDMRQVVVDKAAAIETKIRKAGKEENRR